MAARRRPVHDPLRRCGQVWLHLPAARLGQRAATAFVATPARRDACATHLSPRRLGFYLNEVGLFAMNAGDLATAREYLPLAVRHDRDAGDMRNLAIGLRNLAECLGHLGQAGPARDAAAEALTCAEATGDREQFADSHAYLGWLAGLAGDTAEAEEHFTAADQIQLTDDPDGDHLYSLPRDLVGGVAGPDRAARPGPGADRPQRRNQPRERLERRPGPV